MEMEIGTLRTVIVLLLALILLFTIIAILMAEVGSDNKLVMQVEELKKENLVLKELSVTDALTGLSNRLALTHMLHRLETKAKREEVSDHAVGHDTHPLVCIMADIDNFKPFNDTYGHDVGDMVLKKVAATLRANVREGDFVGRYGGEEFILLFPDTDETSAGLLAEKVRLAVSELDLGIGGPAMPVRVTVSLGVACWHYDQSLEELLKCADLAVYKAKHRGRNQVVFYSQMQK